MIMGGFDQVHTRNKNNLQNGVEKARKSCKMVSKKPEYR